MAIMRFGFNNNEVDFKPTINNVMVNATQMGKIYGKYPKDFLKNVDTKKFIAECLKRENSPNISLEQRKDLIVSRQKSGTWMHRVLALKFAAWLNPAFELWVYTTIESILFEQYRKMDESLKHSAMRRNQIDNLKRELRTDDRYLRLEELELEERQSSYSRGFATRTKLNVYRTQLTEQEIDINDL